MEIACYLLESNVCEIPDERGEEDNIEPVGAMDACPVPERKLDEGKLCQFNSVYDEHNIKKLIEYFETVKKIINGSDYGVTSEDLFTELKTEYGLEKQGYYDLCALGVLGEMDGSAYLNVRTVYIDIDSKYLKKSVEVKEPV